MRRHFPALVLLVPLLTASTFVTVLPAPVAQAAVTMIDGPDVSSYQHPAGAAINWAKVAAAGHEFAIVKATEGTSYANRYFRADYWGIRHAGMVRGSYHYARPAYPLAKSALAQATFYANRLGAANTARTLAPALDLEETGGLSQAALITWAQNFLIDVRRLTGRTPMIYSYPWFWKYAVGDAAAFTRYPLWMASYHGVTPDAGATLWQYTAGAKVSGIRGPVDMSRLLADQATFDALADGVTPTPWPVAAPAAPVAVHADPSVNGATVHWLPGDAGSSAITGYTVTIAPADGSAPAQTVTASATSTAATFTGLVNTVPYLYSVQARNAVGPGAATAPADPVTPQNPTGFTVSGPWSVSFGSAVTLHGVLARTDTGAPLAGVPVVVSARMVGQSGWTTLAMAMTDDTGGVTQSLAPAANDEVRFSYAGDVGVAPATIVRPVVVRRLVSAALSSATTTAGHPVVLTGRATPVAAHVRVSCQRYAGGSWHLVARTTTGRRGWYRLALTQTSLGAVTYRVVIAATPRLGSGVSASVVLAAS